MCIHIYTGDGKGKTTAAVGLAVRFAGNGGTVLFSQFLKDGSSSEICVLDNIEGINVVSCREKMKFSFQMNDEEKLHAADVYNSYLERVLYKAERDNVGLLILDEVIAAYNSGFVDHDRLISFLKEKPDSMEVVLTGRNPACELVELADYISEVVKKKHPFDEGLCARAGIEY